MYDENELTFLFHDKADNPDYFFQGYCFVGNDYVHSNIGYKKFRQNTGKEIQGGEDGCYVVVKRVGDSWEFSSDFSGFKKIFYYWSDSCWCVSNSIVLIIEHLKGRGITFRVNPVQLAAIGVQRSMVLNQLFCENTFIEGIKILPQSYRLVINKDQMKIIRYQTYTSSVDYSAGLLSFSNIWCSRFACLMRQDDLEIRADLTGGKDSRTLFALLKKTNDLLLDVKQLPVICTGSTQNNKIDLEIAQKISAAYGFPHNTRSKLKKINSGKESYSIWKNLCMGVYFPIYFPVQKFQNNIINFSGGGGENHKLQYGNIDIDAFIKNNSEKISQVQLRNAFVAEMKKSFSRMVSDDSMTHPLILHYRQFRARFHAGRQPQYTTCFAPLASSYLERVSAVAGKKRIELGQINFDLMNFLCPDLLEFPFDSAQKAFTEERKSLCTTVLGEVKITPGNVYRGLTAEKTPSEKTQNAYYYLHEEFTEASKKPFVKEFFGDEYIALQTEIMEAALDAKKFEHAIYGQGIHAVIAAGMID